MSDERNLTRREFVEQAALAGAAIALGSGVSAKVASGRAFPVHSFLEVKLDINGRPHTVSADARLTLLDALREDLGLTGTKKGCDHGQCGACTVLVNNRRVLSCLTLAATVTGAKVMTIEGLSTGDKLHPMQDAFIKQDAFQCGYCTSGQIMSAIGLLMETNPANDDEIREGMAGNICRCGAYNGIVAAIREVKGAG